MGKPDQRKLEVEPIKPIALSIVLMAISFETLATGPFAKRAKPADLVTCADPMLEFKRRSDVGGNGLSAVVDTMKRYDLNNDGLVCFSEVKEINPGRTSFFGQMDEDESGCVSPAESRKYIEIQITSHWKQEHKYMDGNRSGQVELSELKTRYSQPPDGGMTPIEILNEFDLDFDGTISLNEYLLRNEEILKELLKRDKHMSAIEPSPIKNPRNIEIRK